MLKSATCRPFISSWSTMVVGFVGIERIAGLMIVDFMAVHVVVDASGLTKFAYSLKIGFLEFRLLWSGFSRRA